MVQRRLRFIEVAATAGLLTMTACAPATAPNPPTAQAAATGVVAPPAASSLRIVGAQFGVDTTMTVQNTGSSPVDLSGWKLRVGTGSATLPTNARVGPGEMLTLHTGDGTSTAGDIYLGQEARPLLHYLLPGASVALLDAGNNVVAEFTLPGGS